MLRRSAMRVVILAVLALGLAGIGGESMAQTTWETTHFVVDDALIDGSDVNAIIEPVWWTVNIYEGIGTYERTLSRFSEPQRLVSALIWYTAEVNNGGHEQFFINSTGIVWEDALKALEVAGLDRFADILSQAIDRFSHPPSQERDSRIAQMEAEEPEFGDLDERFYELEQAIDIDAKLMEYIKEHRSMFYFDGAVRIPVLYPHEKI